METDLIARLVDIAPVVAVLLWVIFDLKKQRDDLMNRYTTLHTRYVRDIRAWAKLPADAFADDLNDPQLQDVEIGRRD